MNNDNDNDVEQKSEVTNVDSGGMGGTVMDIQSPKTSSDAMPPTEAPTDDAPELNQDSSSSEPEPETEPETEPEPDSEPASEPASEPDSEPETEEPIQEPANLPEPPDVAEADFSPASVATNTEEIATEVSFAEPDVVSAVDEDDSQPPAESPLAIPPQVKTKSGTPSMAIIVAIIVAVALAGTAVFMYLKNNDTKQTSGTGQSSNQTIQEKPKATVGDIDTTSQEVDKSLQSIDETADFPTTELSDASLGL